MIRKLSKGFTPLEKVTEEVGSRIPYKADGGFQSEADPPLAEIPPSKQTVRKRSSLTGFTLIEVLISLVILGIGISVIYTIFPLGLRISREIQFLDTVSFFAQKKFEGLKAGTEPFIDANGQEAEFNWTLHIENFTTENNIVLKKAELDFLWIPGKAAIRKKSFFTYFK